jgi:hypothetical protein
MRRILLLFVFLCFSTPNSDAMQVADFDDYDLTNIKYENRIHITHDDQDFDFETDESHDINSDGLLSPFEQNSFLSTDKQCRTYIGNAHSYYTINNALLWIGVAGDFDSFYVDDIKISYEDMVLADDPTVVWPYQETIHGIDYITLVDIESSIGSRLSDSDPVSSCDPYSLTFHSIVSDDQEFYAYITGFGAIKSGFNSVSPQNSDLIWKPDATPIVPEPASVSLFCLGGLGMLVKRRITL